MLYLLRLDFKLEYANFRFQNKRFSINLRTNQCNVSSIDRPFHYRGVHPDARFEQTVALGAPALFGEYLQAGIFAANETDGTFCFSYR